MSVKDGKIKVAEESGDERFAGGVIESLVEKRLEVTTLDAGAR